MQAAHSTRAHGNVFRKLQGKNTIHFIERIPGVSTRDIILSYFDALTSKKPWDAFLAEDMRFTSFVVPIKEVAGKTAYIESTRRFFSMITAVKVNHMIVEGDKACVLTHYELQPPRGDRFRSDVAEVFSVRNGKIDSLAIYFDASPFPK